MAKITASGNLICNGGFEKDYKGSLKAMPRYFIFLLISAPIV
jgi:hypothetical protein